MLHLLKRHWFSVKAKFDFTLGLTFALPADELRPLLYPGLELDEYNGLGFIAVALVQTRNLRPAVFPAFAGRDFFLTGYRIFVRHTTQQQRRLRGLQVLRSDTDDATMVFLGNRLTHYRYEKADVSLVKTDSNLQIRVQTTSRLGDLSVDVNLAEERLPEGSPFPDARTARKFAGPMPFTFSYEPETDSLIQVEGTRSKWQPQLVSAEVHEVRFLKGFSNPILASAFYVEKVPYRWKKGIVSKVPLPFETSSFSGVANIARFNWPQFAAAGAVAVAGNIISREKRIPAPVRRLAHAAGTASLVQSAISLLVSHYIYDRSHLTKWRWLARKLPPQDRPILNIHSGFDETTVRLRKLLPSAEICSIDLYDPRRMTEPSIQRARQIYPPPKDAIKATLQQLPADDGSAGAVLLLFAAHEFRLAPERQLLFQEAARVLAPEGRLFLVEHPRDFFNFAAFGPGALHFHSERTWLRDAGHSFRLKETGKVTPFVRWFEFAPKR